MDTKITVVGAGFVGATCAQRIVEENIADVALIDIAGEMAQGKALDIMQSASLEGFSASIRGGDDYSLTKDSDIVVITAGLARKPGMSRDDLLIKNARIVTDIATQVAPLSPEAILIVVTNPLDVMTYCAHTATGFPSTRVMGMAGVLDAARYRAFIAQALGVSAYEVKAIVLGGHGDSMVPLPRFSTLNGIPVTELLSPERIQDIISRTKSGGAEIVKLLGTGSAFYAPSSSVLAMIKSIIRNTGDIMACSAYLEGAYGLEDVYCGVPVKLSRNGIEAIVELSLNDEEMDLLHHSANNVKENIQKLSEIKTV